MSNNKAVFLDRDGTIIADKGYVHNISDCELLPLSAEAIAEFHNIGFKVIVITNQSGVARGLFSEKDIIKLNENINRELMNTGTFIDAFYYCPHHPNASVPEYKMVCNCRKPNAGLFEKAISDYDINPELSFAIGDSKRDLIPANMLNISSILISREKDGSYVSVPALWDALAIIANITITQERLAI